MELISKKALLDSFGEPHPMDYNAVATIKMIKDAPTIDAVPVTRCRDCTRHKVEMINGVECWRCPLRELDVWPDYYCADGVRE